MRGPHFKGSFVHNSGTLDSILIEQVSYLVEGFHCKWVLLAYLYSMLGGCLEYTVYSSEAIVVQVVITL